MQILTPQDWTDYELLDTGNGYRLERFGSPTDGFILSRPDPDIIWSPHLPESEWLKSDAVFKKSGTSGNWLIKTKMPEKWPVEYKNIKLWVKLSPFKHTGVFPEQAVHWEWMKQKIQDSAIKNHGSEIRVLNLFGYTGAASLVCAGAGAKVTHVDASYPAIGWARDNQRSSDLNQASIRWIQDDCLKFVEREIKRESKYDAIIMDPPSFGHGPSGKSWKFHEDFPKLLRLCKELLSDKPLFILINAYAISSSALMLENILKEITSDLQGNIESGELALEEKGTTRLLSTGIFTRWSQGSSH